MTREEAIQVLNMIEAHGIADEAKRMAIEALSELSIVRCGECKYRPYCNQGVTMRRRYDETINYWSETIDFCSHGERREP